MNRSIRIVHVSSDFHKSYGKLPSRIKELAAKKDVLFREAAFAPSLKTHKLKGPLDGYWAYSVNLEYRVLFRFINAKEVLYLDIGTHEIYK